MEREMELVRKILLTLAEHPHGHAPKQLVIEGYDDETIGYHVFLMGQGDLLDVAVVTGLSSPSPVAIPVSITWKGYEFSTLSGMTRFGSACDPSLPAKAAARPWRW